MKTRNLLTWQEAHYWLHYDPETGVFVWRNGRRTGKPAGCKHRHGYWQIFVDGTLYLAHRLAWLMSHKRWPESCIDHINGQPWDNRLCNLREATHGQNHQSRALQKNNTSGYTGVYFYKATQKWVSRIRVNNKWIFLGGFETAEAAYEAYLEAKKTHHVFQPKPRPNHNQGSLLIGKGFNLLEN